MKKIIPALFCIFLVSCAAQRVAYKEGFNFSEIKSVTVGDFTPSSQMPNSGSVVASEFVRQLLQKGYSVKTSGRGKADYVLTGSVSEYFPNRRYLVINRQQDESKDTIVIQNQELEISGSNVYNLGSAFGMGDESKIIVSNATVGIHAYLKEASTGEVVWSNSYAYEGLDLNTALEGTVGYLLSSWKK
jgi:hypothetical protein